MKKITKILTMVVVAATGLFFCAFHSTSSVEEYAGFLEKTLTEHYNTAEEQSLIKRYELNVTNTGFCRYKRFYHSGKIEYFSFKFSKFSDMDYLGTTNQGKLVLRTKGDDVIVQTYNDKAGDVDSMTNTLTIPLKNLEIDDLNRIKVAITKINTELK